VALVLAGGEVPMLVAQVRRTFGSASHL